MVVRIPKPEDYPKIQELAKKYNFPLPDTFVRALVAEVDNDIVAFAVIRHNLEALFYCNAGNKSIVQSIDAFLADGIETAKKMGHTDIIVFAQDEKFAEVLERRYKFRRAKGIPLILDLEK